MRTVAHRRATLFERQYFADSLLRAHEAVSGLASVGGHAIWKAEGAEAAFDFITEIRHRSKPSGSLSRAKRGFRGGGVDAWNRARRATTGGDVEPMDGSTRHAAR
ncbi:MAG: hypothetical protein ACLPN5_20920 [Roseiarcus sp.]